jgi:two-component system sensor histidine kinase DesK
MIDTRRWITLGRVFMTLWVLFALPNVLFVLQPGFGPAAMAVTFGFLAWGVVWIWFWVRALGASRAAELVGLAGSTAILVMFALIAPQPIGVGGVLVFCFIMAGVSFPIRKAVWVLLGLALMQVVLTLIRIEPLPAATGSLFNSVLVGCVGVAVRLLWQSYTQLLEAREQLAHAAVGEERLRFARDLHDLLGQNLSVLVLKSELVAKQLPADADEGVRQEMRDIAQVARKSLNDVREAVAGYRRPTLAAEISNARSTLRAASITFLVEDGVGPLPAEQDTVLAWCLREAVTNVVKHSGAAKCEARLLCVNGTARLEVADDGKGATSLQGGSGLAGMRERVETVGGTIEVGSKTGGGLQLKVAVPVAPASANGAPAV